MFSDETMIFYGAFKKQNWAIEERDAIIREQSDTITAWKRHSNDLNVTINNKGAEIARLQKENEQLRQNIRDNLAALKKQRSEDEAIKLVADARLNLAWGLYSRLIKYALPHLGNVEEFAEIRNLKHNGISYKNVDKFTYENLFSLIDEIDAKLTKILNKRNLERPEWGTIWPAKSEIQEVLDAIENQKMNSSGSDDYKKTRLAIEEKNLKAELARNEKQKRDLDNKDQAAAKKQANDLSVKAHFVQRQKNDPDSALNHFKKTVKKSEDK